MPIPIMRFRYILWYRLLGGLTGLILGVLDRLRLDPQVRDDIRHDQSGFGEMATALTMVLLSFFKQCEDGVHADRVYMPQLMGLSFGPQIQISYLITGWCSSRSPRCSC